MPMLTFAAALPSGLADHIQQEYVYQAGPLDVGRFRTLNSSRARAGRDVVVGK
jgi:hypothetical protein